MQVNLSAVIITFNEEKNIERCILSIKDIVDEILVLDSFSTDDTQSICKKYGVRFIQHAFDGHIEQKSRAKTLAANEHILSLDADEALDEELKKSILEVKSNWQNDVYKMNRLTNYCGQWIHHSGWYPDTKIRLFDRKKGEWGGTNPHDKFIPHQGASISHLKGDILHYSYYNRGEHLKQIESFSSIGAQALFNKGKKSNWLKIVIKPLARFIKAYILHLGFLDGAAGFTISRLSAYANYLKYVKLKKLQAGKSF
ncbi:MAG: glycosyltransferase family 2 protein [Arenibacter algicola]|nr:glycosyltransferase family 2 protein [Arenibacter algicola]